MQKLNRHQRGGASDYMSSFYSSINPSMGPADISSSTLSGLKNAPMFNPLSQTATVPGGSTGIIPTGLYLSTMQGGGMKIQRGGACGMQRAGGMKIQRGGACGMQRAGGMKIQRGGACGMQRAGGMRMQMGGGSCSGCGSPNTTYTTCPENPAAKNPNCAKHTNSKKCGGQGLDMGMSKAASMPTAASMPKVASMPKAVPIYKPVKSSPTGDRMSAAYYYNLHGKESLGDVCDIRNDGELKCLLLKSNGSPYWAAVAGKSTKQDSCGPQPWKSKCRA